MKRSIGNMEENIVSHIFGSTLVHWVEIYWVVHIKNQCMEKGVYCRSKKMCLEMEMAEINILDFVFQNVAEGLRQSSLFFRKCELTINKQMLQPIYKGCR